MLIKIEQRHIDVGERRHCDLCPIALALNEATRDQWVVSMAHYWRARDQKKLYPLPDAARAWIETYDANRLVLPTEFEMEVL